MRPKPTSIIHLHPSAHGGARHPTAPSVKLSNVYTNWPEPDPMSQATATPFQALHPTQAYFGSPAFNCSIAFFSAFAALAPWSAGAPNPPAVLALRAWFTSTVNLIASTAALVRR